MCQRASSLYLAGTFFFSLRWEEKELSFTVTACAVQHTAEDLRGWSAPAGVVPFLQVAPSRRPRTLPPSPHPGADGGQTRVAPCSSSGDHRGRSSAGTVSSVCNDAGTAGEQKGGHLGSEDHHSGPSFALYSLPFLEPLTLTLPTCFSFPVK